MLSSINAYHSQAVDLLINSSLKTVPTFKIKKITKFWWDEELDALKQDSITANTGWVDAGKPWSGPIFEERNRTRYKYRWRIRKSKLSERSQISLSLQSKLCNKNKTDFWKPWKSKLKNSTRIQIIDGLTEDAEIAEQLAVKFHGICQPNSSIRNKILLDEYNRKILSYGVASREHINFDLNNLAIIVDRLKPGKSPGFDGMTIDHFKYVHPRVLLFLKYLFELMLYAGCVPDDFVRGITVLIPKKKHKIGSLSSDDFRAITINSITSKFFECCLLAKIKKYLPTDKRQFGFKKSTGCSNAIYVLKETVIF